MVADRHVADILGHSVYVGDQVVAMVKYASGSSSRRAEMVLGYVVEILPTHLRLRCEVPYGRPAKMLRLVTLVKDSRVVKVTERRP